MGKKNKILNSEDELTEAIRVLGKTQGLDTAFTTFLEIFATSLSAETDLINKQKRKERYEQIVEKMEPKIQTEYARLCALMYKAVRENADEPIDILGAVFHRLNLSNSWNGQFFTPDDISRLMAAITFSQEEDSNGIIKTGDPACGAGSLMIGTAWLMLKNHIDYKTKCLFVCQDIDIRCVWMAYIQFTLYKMPAVIYHGDSLREDVWDCWYTPNYFRLKGEAE